MLNWNVSIKIDKLVQKYQLNHYNVFSEKKFAKAESVNRTLQNMIWKQVSLRDNYKWLESLKNIIKKKQLKLNCWKLRKI